MFDTHLHTEFSTDSEMKIEDAINRSKELSIGLTITEHMDLSREEELKNAANGYFIFDMDDYINAYMPYRSESLLLGVEFGLKPETYDINKKLSETYPLDYVIGSIHVVDGKSVESRVFYEGRTRDEVYENYLCYMLNNLKKHSFIDSLAHIDYISRYSIFEDKEIYCDRYLDLIDEIFEVMVDNEIALEINTKRFMDKAAVENMKKICKRYRKHNGVYVTLGSDSHITENIGRNFDYAMEIVNNCDLKPVYFKNRIMNYMK